jgi:hypothetical protein
MKMMNWHFWYDNSAIFEHGRSGSMTIAAATIKKHFASNATRRGTPSKIAIPFIPSSPHGTKRKARNEKESLMTDASEMIDDPMIDVNDAKIDPIVDMRIDAKRGVTIEEGTRRRRITPPS